MQTRTTLVATLGGQPQIVTFALDLLLEKEEPVDQVVVLYLPGSARYAQAYRTLSGEFTGDLYQGRRCHLRGLPLRRGQTDLADAVSPNEVEAIRKTIHNLLADLKEEGHILHLSLSGGRRIMSLVALAAAAQYLEPTDHLWHIYTPDALIEQARGGALMHLPPGSGVRLIEIPFVPWAAWFPGLSPLLDRSPRELTQAGWLSEADRKRCRQVWDKIRPRHKEVLRAFAEGLSRQEVAARLHIVPATVDDHRESILAACQDVWGQDGLVFNDRKLRELFQPFLNGLE